MIPHEMLKTNQKRSRSRSRMGLVSAYWWVLLDAAPLNLNSWPTPENLKRTNFVNLNTERWPSTVLVD